MPGVVRIITLEAAEPRDTDASRVRDSGQQGEERVSQRFSFIASCTSFGAVPRSAANTESRS